MHRKLTAILSADVVGYSGMMEADEAGTLERLKVNRARIDLRCRNFNLAQQRHDLFRTELPLRHDPTPFQDSF